MGHLPEVENVTQKTGELSRGVIDYLTVSMVTEREKKENKVEKIIKEMKELF